MSLRTVSMRMKRCEAIYYVLLCFEVVSSLALNLTKFEFILVGEVPQVELLVSVIGCEIKALLV